MLKPFFAMTVVVIASNYLVLFPLNDWLTWGAFPYPLSYLITELTNRQHGPKNARKVVYLGFIVALFASYWLATPKIAAASATAFFTSQLLDIFVFNNFRQGVWWRAPLVSSVSASLIDATLFWTVAFWGEEVPLLSWAIGDTSVKLALDLAMLAPFRVAMNKIPISFLPKTKGPSKQALLNEAFPL